MAMDIKGERIAMFVVGAFVLLILMGALIPEASDAVNELNDSNRCEALSCTYNATEVGDECRESTNNTAICLQGQGEIPLGNTFSLIITLIMLGIFIALIVSAMRFGFKKGK